MFEVLVLGAFIAIMTTFVIAIYLGFKEATREPTPPPVSKQDWEKLIDSFISKIDDIANDGEKTLKIELFESELRTYDRFRRKIKELAQVD